VHVPPGTYTVSGNGLTFYSDITIEGEVYGSAATAAPAGASILKMASSNLNAFLFNPTTPAGAVVANTVFRNLILSIQNNSNALGVIELTNCHTTTLEHCTFTGGTNASGACIRWIGGPVAGNTGFGTIHQCGFATTSSFGSIFLFGGSSADQPDGISITDCYASAASAWLKFASSGGGHGPSTVNVKGCRFEANSGSAVAAITSDANGFGGAIVGNRFENTGSGGLTVTLYGVGTQQCAQFVANSWAPGSGGLTWTDNGNVPSTLFADQNTSSNVNNRLNGLQMTMRTVTGNATLTVNDFLLLADATSGNLTVTLPSATTIKGAGSPFFRIVKIDSSANTVTVSPAAGTLNGAASKALNAQYQSLDVQSDGTNYFIAAAHGISMVGFTVPSFSTIAFGSTAAGYLQVDGTPKFIWSLNNSSQLTLTTSALSPTAAGGKALGTSALPYAQFFSSSRSTDGVAAPSWATNITVDAGVANYHIVTITSTGVAATLSNPTNVPAAGQSQLLCIECFNNAGAALSTPIAFGTKYKNTGTVSPANGTSRVIAFRYNQVRDLWIEVARTSADV
jgi:hypothetical protein